MERNPGLPLCYQVRVPKARPREVIADGTAQFQRPQHFGDGNTMALPSMITVAVKQSQCEQNQRHAIVQASWSPEDCE